MPAMMQYFILATVGQELLVHGLTLCLPYIPDGNVMYIL